MSANRIKIKLLRVSSLSDPKVSVVDYGEHFVIDSTGALYYKHHITGEILAASSAAITPYTLPAASSAALGGVRIGSGLSIDVNGILSAAAVSYTLPVASFASLGGIKIGSGLSIDGAGVVSVAAGTAYSLPNASASILGGVKVGSGLSIDASGVLSAAVGSAYSLPAASASILGGVKVGSGLSVDGSGVLSAAGNMQGFEFTVQFSGANPASVTGMPAGWTSSISGTDITVTHTTGKALKSIQYWGYSSSGGLDRYRLPSASNEATIPYAARTSQFVFRITTAVAGADADSTARIVCMF